MWRERLRKRALSKPVQVTALLRSWSRKLLRLLLLHKKKQDAQFPYIQTSELWARRFWMRSRKMGGNRRKPFSAICRETQIDIITALFWIEEQPSALMSRIKRLTVRTQRLRKISAGCWIGGMRTRSFLAWMPEEWKDLLPIENRLEEPMAWSIFSHGLFHC